MNNGVGTGTGEQKYKPKGAENIEQYWRELETVLENIGMDDIWLEINEPREEQNSRTSDRKRMRVDSTTKEKGTEENIAKGTVQKEKAEEDGDRTPQREQTGNLDGGNKYGIETLKEQQRANL